MADQFKVLECVVDEELAALKRQVIELAAATRFDKAALKEDTIIHVEMDMDLNAVLRCSTSCRTVTTTKKEKK